MNVYERPRMEVDFETRSEAPLGKQNSVGAWRYAEHHTTEILCLSYGLHDHPKKLWTPAVPFPEEILRHVKEGGVLEAHGAFFEMCIWFHILHKKMDIPMPTRWMDTMATCAYRSLPLGLDAVGDVLDLGVKKDKRGKYLIQRLCKPRKPLKKEREAFIAQGLQEHEWPLLWVEDWDLLEELYDYCIRDSDTEEELAKTVGDLPPAEYRVWVLDQIINRRGVRLDIEAVQAMKGIAEIVTEKLTVELIELTDGEVQTANQRDKIINWLGEKHNYHIDDLTADTVERALEDVAGFPEVQRLLEIRQQLARASTKKLQKMINCVGSDGRLHGLLQYHGASTGRWAGRLVQPHNFPRGELEKYGAKLGIYDDAKVMELLVDVIKFGDVNLLEDLFGDPMTAVASALRGTFVAAPNHDFVVADFSAIEAVFIAWLAGEVWKVEAFRRIQNGEGYKGAPDIYCATASNVFGYAVTDKKLQAKERGVGKVCELAFGYQGGLGAWRNFDKSDRYSDEEVEFFKRQWRDEHPMICALWYGLEDAAVSTVTTGRPHSYVGIIYSIVEDRAGKWLTCRLPNGRPLWYYEPFLVDSPMPWQKDKQQVCYQGRDSKRNGLWGVIRTYGGMLAENVVQAGSRDLMVDAMFRVEEARYPIILTVHDEIVSEIPVDFGSLEEYEELMSVVPAWAKGCPVGVDGWRGDRYRK